MAFTDRIRARPLCMAARLCMYATATCALACAPSHVENTSRAVAVPFVVVLGVAQDGSHPQAGCTRKCCVRMVNGRRHHVASLGLVDPPSSARWLIDATPDLPSQLSTLDTYAPRSTPIVSGVFLTHGHIGHYAGLIHFGREVMGTSIIPVYAMPRMQHFLEHNAPWELLVRLRNVEIHPMSDGLPVVLNERLTVVPIVVPHRDEYTETVGFSIRGPKKRALYIPDIDKWEKWSTSIESQIAVHDLAWIDGTFFAESDLPNRRMAEVPHPFMVESISRLGHLSTSERAKVRFIHLNHSNDALDAESDASKLIRSKGFAVASEGDIAPLE